MISTEERVRDIFKTIHQAMREVVTGIDLPLVVGAKMRCVEDSVGSQIPHLRIPVLQILLHTEKGLLGAVLAILHILKFEKRLADGPRAVNTRLGTTAFFSSVDLDSFLCGGGSFRKPNTGTRERKKRH